MSGGHFDYRETALTYIAEQLEKDIEFNDVEYDSKKSDGSYGFQHDLETIKFMQTIIANLQTLRRLLKDYDYAVSGDSSIEEFINNAREVYKI